MFNLIINKIQIGFVSSQVEGWCSIGTLVFSGLHYWGTLNGAGGMHQHNLYGGMIFLILLLMKYVATDNKQ